MKTQRYSLIFLIIAILLTTLLGCRKTCSYSFDQDLSNIASVEICRYDYHTDSTTSIMCLDEDASMKLLKDIAALNSYKPWSGDGTRDYGEIVVYITYQNKEAEVIGMVHSASVDIKGEWWIKPDYFDYAEWSAVIMENVGEDVVPELKKYVENQSGTVL